MRLRPPPLPAIDPMPPRLGGPLPWVEAGAALLRDPTACFTSARRRFGDTFVVDAFGYRLFSVFSPAGVARLYALAEHEASFGLATFELVLKRKLPTELLAGRRTFPHALFGGQDEDYLGHLHEAMRLQLDELGAAGTFEAFALARRLGHRLGLASWAGREAAAPGTLDRLIPPLDRLDSGDSFVRPAQAFVTALTRKAPERRAMREVEAIIGDILRARRRAGTPVGDYLDRIAAPFADLPEAERDAQTARDVMVIHMGAQSNLYAALAWTLVNLLRQPALLAAVRAGDDVLLEQCANESIRMAQRSITLRYVMSRLDFDDGERTYRLDPGVMITTMLPVTNTSAAPGLERFDPAHYESQAVGHRVAADPRVGKYVRHGRHACPAQRFAIRRSESRSAPRSTLRPDPGPADVRPRRRWIGGVAQAAAPRPVAMPGDRYTADGWRPKSRDWP
jgi:cytochrome P450